MKSFIPIFSIFLLCSCSGKNIGQQIEKDSIEIFQDTFEVNATNCVRVVDVIDTRTYESTRDMLLEDLDSAEINDRSVLYGYWFKPHEASAVNIIFKKNNTFVMRDYEIEDDDHIIYYERIGTFELKEDSVYMSSKDGWYLSLGYWNDSENTGKYLSLDDKNSVTGLRYFLVKGGI